jgi:PAS domain S-box-containing protein
MADSGRDRSRDVPVSGTGHREHPLPPGRPAGLQDRTFRLLVEAVQDYGIYMLDPYGRVVSWNEGAERIKGYEEGEVLGRSFEIFHTAEDRAAGRPQRALEVAAREGVFRDERWRLRRDGSRFWAHVTLTALRDEDGTLLGFAKVTRDLTDRRNSELALQESEERFRQLADNAREVFWLYSGDYTQLLYVSPAFEQVWGFPAEELNRDGTLWRDSVHPHDAPAMDAFMATLRKQRSVLRFRIRRPDGEMRWLVTNGFPVTGPDGTVARIGGVTEDITEEVETEQQLRYLAEAGRVLTSSIDYEETLRNVSRLAVPQVADWCVVDILEDGALNRLSVTHTDPAREAIAWELVRHYPPDVNAQGGVAEVLRTGIPQVFHEIPEAALQQIAQDDKHLQVLQELGLRSSMILPMTARGRVLGTISFVLAESGRRFNDDDLDFATELAARAALAVDNARLYREAQSARGEAERRAHQEKALRRAAQAVTATFDEDEVIRHLVENAMPATNSDAAFFNRIDAGSGEVYVVARVGGIAPPIGARGEYEGSCTRTAMERGEALLVPSLREAGDTILAEILNFCDDCSAMVVPLIDASTAVGALILARTPERQSFRPDELDRARTFADLASLGFRKIHLLQESEARREELEEAIESRARLIRGFTHDLKNPLGAADGYLQMIESGIISEPDHQELSIGRTRRAIRTALDLIGDLSQLAQAEAGQIEVDPSPVDVREIAAELAEEYRPQAEGRGLDIDCSMPGRLPVIRSDSTRIRQVLGNLISNAVKYTEQGHVRVTVSSRRGRAAPSRGRWIAVEVADTGRGIPREMQHLLFREFSRIEPGEVPGVGLGLAISQRVAHALGGSITVSSRPGEGSAFTLWLPLDQVRSYP